jgi:hypothetical protein
MDELWRMITACGGDVYRVYTGRGGEVAGAITISSL